MYLPAGTKPSVFDIKEPAELTTEEPECNVPGTSIQRGRHRRSSSTETAREKAAREKREVRKVAEVTPPPLPPKKLTERQKRNIKKRKEEAAEKVLQEAANEALRQREKEAREHGPLLHQELGTLAQALTALTHQLSH